VGTNLKQNRAFDKRFSLNLAEKMQGACFDRYLLQDPVIVLRRKLFFMKGI
jgi:hypothetical protein